MSQGVEHLVIEGGKPLEGTVHISGSKNLVPAVMAAALLTPEQCILENVPRIGDVDIMADILRSIGAEVEWRSTHTLRINAENIHTTVIPSRLAVQNRGSFLAAGPLLARFGEAACTIPGGDIIGRRPLEVHLIGFQALGANLSRRDDKYVVQTPNLQGSRIFLDYPSNMGTENLLMAATLASGQTRLQNAACEPEVVALSQMLNQMGAKVKSVDGTRTIYIEGVNKLHGTTFSLIPDRIEAGTYAVAAAITGGEVTLEGVNNDHLDGVWWKLQQAGVEVSMDNSSTVVRAGKQVKELNINTLPYPGFPTDLQPIMVTFLTQADGVSMLEERVFDDRLLYVSQLRKMGAEIVVAGETAIISGPTPLSGTAVRSLDIRSGAALVVAGLAASGQTHLEDIYHVDRGYEAIEKKLQGLGANIWRRIQYN